MPGMLNTREAGRITIFGPDGTVEYGTCGCVHCGGHFPAPRFGASEEDKATRVGRGFCFNCNGYICGPCCEVCVPEEQYLENLEAGRDPNFRPIMVSVPNTMELTDGIAKRVQGHSAAARRGGR
jgi:hypothetical protein